MSLKKLICTAQQLPEMFKMPIERFSKEVCRSLIAMLDFDRSGKLGLVEFKKLILEIFTWEVCLK